MKAIIFTAIVGTFAACKTTKLNNEPTSQVKDFDDQADEDVEFRRTFDYSFCPVADKLTIINSYWLAVASNFAYGSRALINQTVTEINQTYSARAEFIFNEAKENRLGVSTQALWIEFDNMIILAFRGTQTGAADISTDARFRQRPYNAAMPNMGNIHNGFKAGVDAVWDEVKSKLKNVNPSRKALWITGHSLGGALATLAAAQISTDPELALNARQAMKGLYTYGSPRVGDQTFLDGFKTAVRTIPTFHIARFRNYMDIVTRVPPSRGLFNFVHVGQMYYLDSSGRIYSDTNDIKFRRIFMPSATLTGMIEDYASYIGGMAFSRYSDHSMLKYIAKLGTEYNLHKDWTTANRKDICDMGMYETMWEQDNAPKVTAPWTNNVGVATARQENSATVRNCCWCDRTWYTSNWGTDEAYKRENFVGVIQDGEIASGNCVHPGGQEMGFLWWQNEKYLHPNGYYYNHYYTYSGCERITIAGDRCVTGAELWENGTKTGRYIRTESWKP